MTANRLDADNNELTSTLLFSIQDTGIGIPRQKLETVFHRFAQVDASTTRKYGGTGLGLAICRKLSIFMGGEMWVESEPGSGSTFFFTVRLKETGEHEAGRVESYSSPLSSRSRFLRRIKPLRILLAEDFVVNQEVTIPILKENGHRVHVVENGKEAVQAVQEHPFDLILMDIQMPVMDGIEATRRIRELTDLKAVTIPIIALTANASKGDCQEYIDSGIDFCLTKPIRPSLLLETVENIARYRELERPPSNPQPSSDHTDFDYALEMMDGQNDILLTACNTIAKIMPQKMEEMRGALSRMEYRNLERLAHSIKSGGNSIGARQLSNIAHRVEHYANRKHHQQIEDLMPALQKSVESVLSDVHDYTLKYEMPAA